MAFLLVSTLFFILVGCSNQAAVDDAIAEGIAFIEADAYEEAEKSFQEALELKPEEEQAINLLLQTQLIQQAFDDLEKGELDSATAVVDDIKSIEAGSEHLVTRANDIQAEIDILTEKLAEFETSLLEAEALLVNEEVVDGIELLEEVLTEDFDHIVFEDMKTDFETLLAEAQLRHAEIEKEREEAERKAAEEKAKKEAEELARKEAEEKAAEEAKQVADFTGYWLNDEFACHMTTTYVTCAMPYSDFITDDNITNINPISSTEVEITTDNGYTTLYKLSNNNSTLEVPGGTYKRVSKEEANAIYDGQYELR